MLISYRKNFVFIHIFKTGGTSLMKLLVPYARPRERLVYGGSGWARLRQLIIRASSPAVLPRIAGIEQHATFVAMRDYVGAERFRRMFKFAVVRHPYDWMISHYFHILRTPTHKLHGAVAGGSFDDFVAFQVGRNPRRQVDFVCDERGEVGADFIARYEQLDQDVAEILDTIGLQRRSLPHLNEGGNRPERDTAAFFARRETRDAMQAYFAEDFSVLGYDA